MALPPESPTSILERVLARKVSLWVVAAIVLFFSVGTVAFAWYVKRSVILEDEHPVAQAAVDVASFPTDVRNVALEVRSLIRSLVSGKPDYRDVRAAPSETEWTDFRPVASGIKNKAEGLIMRRGPGALAQGWRIIVGAFKGDGSVQHAALMLSPNLRIVHYWPLLEDGPEAGQTDGDSEPPRRKLPHGFSVLRDGSVIYAFDNGSSLHRKDRCGRTIWADAGKYHHSVTADDTQTTVWTLRHDDDGDWAQREKIVQLAVADGKVIREISVADIIAANPDIDILEVRRNHDDRLGKNPRGLPGRWVRDPFHLNDVDPLPRKLAGAFPQFAAGDLLLSARNLNLLFVVDPDTLAVKWWRAGATIRQHDPDWMADGRISALNNRTARGYSEIVEIDPATLATAMMVDGRDLDFYSRARGKVEPIPGGGWLITSAEQGRVVEVSPDGKIALEFYSVLDEEAPTFGILSQAVLLPEGSIDIGAFQWPGPASSACARTSESVTADEVKEESDRGAGILHAAGVLRQGRAGAGSALAAR
ncbi:MAG TPA: arylsulfotransferase family protein [Dongiaceae bacterium]